MKIKVCRSCHQYYFGTELCPTCGNFQCWDCGQTFHINLSNIKPNRGYNTCPTCRARNKKYTLKCEIHGFFYSDSPVYTCRKCVLNKQQIYPQFKICGCGDVYIQKAKTPPFLCNKCKTDNLGKWGDPSKYDEEVKIFRKSHSSNIMKSLHSNDGIKFCSKCNKNTYHILAVGCMFCHNNSDTMKLATAKRNLYNWQNDPEYRKRIASNLCSEIVYRYNNDKITHINDIPIEEYYQILPQEDFLSSLFPIGFYISTGLFQVQTGKFTGKLSLDQRLVDLNIGYFVYIKNYINIEGKSLPLQVCKSTTTLVTKSIPDFSFDYSKGGAARQFLLDNNLKWDQEKVFIIPISKEDYGSQGCPSQTEKYIHDEIKLFY